MFPSEAAKGKLPLLLAFVFSIGMLFGSAQNGLLASSFSDFDNGMRQAQLSDLPNISTAPKAKKAALVPALDNSPARLLVTLDKTNDAKLEFVHIPKTGGTAVEIAGARQNVTWGLCHYRNMPTENYLNEDKANLPGCFLPKRPLNPCGRGECWHQLPSHLLQQSGWTCPYHKKNLFAVVRNPYTRMISSYYCPYRGYKGAEKNPETLKQFLYGKLHKMRTTKPNNPHSFPQSHFIFDFDNMPGEQESAAAPPQMVDHVLFYEDFANQFHALMKKYNLPVALDSHKVNPGKENGTPRLGLGDLDPESISLINEVYRDDFEYLGYKVLNPDGLGEDWAKQYDDKSIYMVS